MKVYSFMDKMYGNLWDVLENNQKRIRRLLGTDVILDRFAMITDIYMPAMIEHQKIFPKYKGINKGRTIVITGTGPTFEYYIPMNDVIHIGINNAIFREDICFDYLFVGDYDDNDALFEKIFSCKYDLVKFFGRNYRRKGAMIPEYLRKKENVENYYVDSYDWNLYGANLEKYSKTLFNHDISVSPFKSYGTTFYCAFQFALWTYPEKIYIVGADCWGKSHAKNLNYGNTSFDNRSFIRPWRKMKEFVDEYYPNVEVISLNPVGLKNIFIDKYTKEFKNYYA